MRVYDEPISKMSARTQTKRLYLLLYYEYIIIIILFTLLQNTYDLSTRRLV